MQKKGFCTLAIWEIAELKTDRVALCLESERLQLQSRDSRNASFAEFTKVGKAPPVPLWGPRKGSPLRGSGLANGETDLLQYSYGQRKSSLCKKRRAPRGTKSRFKGKRIPSAHICEGSSGWLLGACGERDFHHVAFISTWKYYKLFSSWKIKWKGTAPLIFSA